MENTKIESFNIIGIKTRTTNQNGQSGTDIPNLWAKFMSGQWLEKIPNKVNNTIYCLYTDYEDDHTMPYSAVLGCKVPSLQNVPADMVGLSVQGGNFCKFKAKGNLMQGIVYKAWIKIWDNPLPRAFTTDFEVYDEKSQTPENAEVDIFVAIKK